MIHLQLKLYASLFGFLPKKTTISWLEIALEKLFGHDPMSVGMILSSVLLRCKRFAYGAVRPSFSNKGPPRSDAKSAEQNMKPFASTGNTKICRDMVGSVEYLTKPRESIWGLKQETHKRDIYYYTVCKIYCIQFKYKNCLEHPNPGNFTGFKRYTPWLVLTKCTFFPCFFPETPGFQEKKPGKFRLRFYAHRSMKVKALVWMIRMGIHFFFVLGWVDFLKKKSTIPSSVSPWFTRGFEWGLLPWDCCYETPGLGKKKRVSNLTLQILRVLWFLRYISTNK